MDIEQCWMRFLKAEQLLDQGHWPEAHHLYKEVLDYLPDHLLAAVESGTLKPCQFLCLLNGLRESSVKQSEILNKLGQHREAFSTLNQCYALLQFLALEPGVFIQRVQGYLRQHSEDILAYLSAFCHAQHSEQWTMEYAQVQNAHQHFIQLQEQMNNGVFSSQAFHS